MAYKLTNKQIADFRAGYTAAATRLSKGKFVRDFAAASGVSTRALYRYSPKHLRRKRAKAGATTATQKAAKVRQVSDKVSLNDLFALASMVSESATKKALAGVVIQYVGDSNG